MARVGRYGPYLQRGEDRVSIPEDLAPDELTVERAEALLEAPSSDRVLGEDPETGPAGAGQGRPLRSLRAARRAGRRRPEAPDLVAVRLDVARPPSPSSRPSTCCASRGWWGPTPTTGEEIVAHNGKFGPYLKKGTDTRSLLTEDQILIGHRGRGPGPVRPAQDPWGRNAKGPLREMGADPDTGLPMVVKDGRFGPYVTDGTTNASLRRGDDVESLTVERAAELLAERRAAGPSTRKKAPAKKAPAKKAGAKKAPAKKTAAKKAPAKKAGGHQGGRRRRRQPTQAAAGGSDEDRTLRVTASARGRLIALEGIDGCGKSTQARLLADRLGALLTFEPGATALGASLRTAAPRARAGPGGRAGRGAADGRRPGPARGRGGATGPGSAGRGW